MYIFLRRTDAPTHSATAAPWWVARKRTSGEGQLIPSRIYIRVVGYMYICKYKHVVNKKHVSYIHTKNATRVRSVSMAHKGATEASEKIGPASSFVAPDWDQV